MSGRWRRPWLVARREWNQRARSRAFLISTAITVLIVVAVACFLLYVPASARRRRA